MQLRHVRALIVVSFFKLRSAQMVQSCYRRFKCAKRMCNAAIAWISAVQLLSWPKGFNMLGTLLVMNQLLSQETAYLKLCVWCWTNKVHILGPPRQFFTLYNMRRRTSGLQSNLSHRFRSSAVDSWTGELVFFAHHMLVYTKQFKVLPTVWLGYIDDMHAGLS